MKEPLCNGITHSWSEWMNTDSPDGDGDLELIELLGLGCADSTYMQIQTVDGISYENSGQVVHYKPCFGFICLNSEQKENETCKDYQVRQCCPILQTTTSETSTEETEIEQTTSGSEITSSTEAIITGTTTSLTTAEPAEPCSFTIKFLNDSNIFIVKENSSKITISLEFVKNKHDCVLNYKDVIKVAMVDYTAKINKDFESNLTLNQFKS